MKTLSHVITPMRVFVGTAAVFLAAQLVPYGREHANSQTTPHEPSWENADVRALAQRACFDCHSNQTEWPWYASVAPLSWYIQHHVEDARAAVNFSEWDRAQKDADELVEVIEEHEMPLASYLLLHPDARLSEEETQTLLHGLRMIVDALPAK